MKDAAVLISSSMFFVAGKSLKRTMAGKRAMAKRCGVGPVEIMGT